LLIAYYGDLFFDQRKSCDAALVDAGACFVTGAEYLDSLELNHNAGFQDNVLDALAYEGVWALLVLAAFYRVAYF